MRSELYWERYTLTDRVYESDRYAVVGYEQQNDIGFKAMCVLAEESQVRRPKYSAKHLHFDWINGLPTAVRASQLVVQSGESCCRGRRHTENVVLDALNALCLNARHGYLVMDSSVIMSLSEGYDTKFDVSNEVREQTHTIVFPFNAEGVHWFMVVMRKTLLFGPEVRST